MSSQSSKLGRTSQTKRCIIWNLQHRATSIIYELKTQMHFLISSDGCESNHYCRRLVTIEFRGFLIVSVSNVDATTPHQYSVSPVKIPATSRKDALFWQPKLRSEITVKPLALGQ